MAVILILLGFIPVLGLDSRPGILNHLRQIALEKSKIADGEVIHL